MRNVIGILAIGSILVAGAPQAFAATSSAGKTNFTSNLNFQLSAYRTGADRPAWRIGSKDILNDLAGTTFTNRAPTNIVVTTIDFDLTGFDTADTNAQNGSITWTNGPGDVTVVENTNVPPEFTITTNFLPALMTVPPSLKKAKLLVRLPQTNTFQVLIRTGSGKTVTNYDVTGLFSRQVQTSMSAGTATRRTMRSFDRIAYTNQVKNTLLTVQGFSAGSQGPGTKAGSLVTKTFNLSGAGSGANTTSSNLVIMGRVSATGGRFEE